jgi:lipopolysaccharide/colanic/teichoic acid biosynthesis glycosyltransferase
VKVWSKSGWDAVQHCLDMGLILLTSPLWLPVLLILLGFKVLIDGSPVLFRQVRLGRDGVPFDLYKITTTPADYRARPADWTDHDFPPRTRFGQWLRRFDLDELPQLWNVLTGDMSLVGPRPETPFHAARLEQDLPGFGERLLVRPGLTGLAQVRGWRGDTSMARRLEADLDYLRERGLRLWLTILLRTIWVELAGRPSDLRQSVIVPVTGRRVMRSQSDFQNS